MCMSQPRVLDSIRQMSPFVEVDGHSKMAVGILAATGPQIFFRRTLRSGRGWSDLRLLHTSATVIQIGPFKSQTRVSRLWPKMIDLHGFFAAATIVECETVGAPSTKHLPQVGGVTSHLIEWARIWTTFNSHARFCSWINADTAWSPKTRRCWSAESSGA